MEIRIRKSAIKDLSKIDSKHATKIKKMILKLGDYPDVSNVRKLTNFEPAFRYRIGNYRVLFDIVDNVIFVGRVLHRKESYK
ncbi:type II toxin-antitoxin system RelE/ParE family toxin [Thiospirochaeta perfilievii]|uniref:Type II toxin-antitoxin system RelE/ParE family toxin n=1 Tax=Thiospirochaeta perfilievii TaxID=252967 RepID=A0A5C1QC30_9SPIO|nr:type II toxin-antitoxin system RelE/ParE family toxin [Thiospirochaeta perfilievii]QEN05643.1 type II toxin-antitoxin system RelE/ParE family toxin [Thiospirochaeta perfilievii]